MAGGSGMPANRGQGIRAERDIRGDIVAGLSEDVFPNLKGFFEVLQDPVIVDKGILQVLAGVQSNLIANSLLKIIEGIVTTQNNQYNTLATQAANVADIVQIDFNRLNSDVQCIVNKIQNKLNKYKEALIKI